MKKALLLSLGAMLAMTALSAQARDTKKILPINDALKSSEASQVLDPKISVKFGGGSGDIIKKGVVTNRKTNAFGKSDEEACQWALLSGIKQLQEAAQKAGGTRVINVVSYYKKNTMKSNAEYECHAGGVVAGVALKGDIAR